MKTIVSIPHHEYPARVRDHVERKLQHLLKFYARIVSVRALLERESERHRVELVANIGHGVTLVVDVRESGLEAAVDLAVSRMARVLRRHKSRIAGKQRRARRMAG